MIKYISKFINSVPILIGFSIVFFFFQDQALHFSEKYFGSKDIKEFYIFAFFVIYTLLCFLVAPAITNKIVYRESLKEMGLVFPEKKILSLVLIILSLIILVPCIIYFAKLSAFQGYSLAHLSTHKFIFAITFLFPLFYIGEEFFFRGFLFLGLWKRVGWHSFWITDIIFTLSHFGKPWLEVLMCIPASVVFNVLTLCTRSIFPAVVVHSLLGIILSILVTFNLVF